MTFEHTEGHIYNKYTKNKYRNSKYGTMSRCHNPDKTEYRDKLPIYFKHAIVSKRYHMNVPR